MNSGFWRVDNPLYAAVSMFAYESGSLWTLHAGEQQYFNKPPLAFWVHGAVLRLFGAELWAARLPSLLAAMATVLMSIDSVRRMAGRRAAMASGVVLALTLEFFRSMHSISLDLWLAMFITGSAWCVVRGLLSGRVFVWCTAAGLFIGAGLMVKPMIALAALPLIGVWLGVLRRWRVLAGLLLSAGVAIAVALPWHLSMASIHGDAFLAEYFGSQILDRVTTDAHGAEPWWKYLAQIGETYWPWLITFVLGASMLRGERMHRRSQAAVLLGVVFTLGWIVMLSVSHDKAGRYLIPVYPFASWVSGVWIARVMMPGWGARMHRALRLTVFAAPAMGLLLALFGPNPHGTIPAHWAELRDFVRAHPDDRLFVPPRSRTLGAQLYLMRDGWPGVARWGEGVGEDAGGADPPAGSLLVTRRSGALQARPGDQTMFENRSFRIVRLATDWDGDYSVVSGGALDEDASE